MKIEYDDAIFIAAGREAARKRKTHEILVFECIVDAAVAPFTFGAGRGFSSEAAPPPSSQTSASAKRTRYANGLSTHILETHEHCVLAAVAALCPLFLLSILQLYRKESTSPLSSQLPLEPRLEHNAKFPLCRRSDTAGASSVCAVCRIE